MTDYTMTNQEFICAAGSYFGLPGEQLMQGSKLETQEDGALEIVIRLALTPEDMIGIGKRMEAMREIQTEKISIEDLDDITDRTSPEQFNDMRAQYNALSKEERSRYGSFARFAQGALLREETEGVGGRKVSHIDAPEEEEPAQMDAVWLMGKECTEAQVLHSSDSRWKVGSFDVAEYLVPWSMLTEEQKSKYDKRYVVLSADQCSDEQKDGALDYDEDTHQYVVPYRLLTEEQRQKAKESGK